MRAGGTTAELLSVKSVMTEAYGHSKQGVSAHSSSSEALERQPASADKPVPKSQRQCNGRIMSPHVHPWFRSSHQGRHPVTICHTVAANGSLAAESAPTNEQQLFYLHGATYYGLIESRSTHQVCGADGFGVRGAFDAARCGSTGPDAWHLKYAELHRRILSGRAPQRYIVAQVTAVEG